MSVLKIQDLEVLAAVSDEARREVLTDEALTFVADLHARFNPTRLELLESRKKRQKDIDGGQFPDFLDETKDIRAGQWTVAEVPHDLQDRRVEITGPVEAKMMINALNSGAKVFMGDFEDSLSPTWSNIIGGQIHCKQAVRRTLTFKDETKGKFYELGKNLATLIIRPRGWHLEEKHVRVEGAPMSASLFDFGLYFFHNAKEALSRGTGPYFYLPKLESHKEARLWNEVFKYSQDQLGIPQGTIKATVLIETITAAFETEEILYELRDHSAGLNAGRWDYIFSAIKKFHKFSDRILPDRSQVTMTVPFMRAYTERLIQSCHRRGAHAIGGMSAFIPSRKDPRVNEAAIGKVREDKNREAQDGCDGTWVAHPDLVPVAMEIFDEVLGDKPNQRDKQRPDVRVTAKELLDFKIPGGTVTEEGFAHNIRVAMQYLDHWLAGSGAVALYNLMEDAATAEISRAQLWQWIHHEARTDSGRRIDKDYYRQVRDSELNKLGGPSKGRLGEVVEILDGLVLAEQFSEFLTIPAYDRLD